MEKKIFRIEKLVRDKIPEFMRSKGIIVHGYPITDKNQYIQCLKDKLMEEVLEIIQSKDSEELVEELVDLLEVVYALVLEVGKNFHDLEIARQVKKLDKGGFDNQIYNTTVEIEISNPAINYFLMRPKKYPETQ